MAYKLYDDGAVIRVENGTSVLLVTKSQVKTIDIIHGDIVRLDIGEGPLKNIFVRYTEVEIPVVSSAAQLRDVIKAMMPNLSEDDAILGELQNIKGVLNALKLSEADLLKTEPSRVDESQPNTIYKGWHKDRGIPSDPEWAILKITRTADNIIYEWAGGSIKQNNVWNNRLERIYLPLDYIGLMEFPLPPAPQDLESPQMAE
jgi:hypothetical protein